MSAPIKIKPVNGFVLVEYTIPKIIRDKVYPINEDDVCTLSDQELEQFDNFNPKWTFEEGRQKPIFADILFYKLSTVADQFEEFTRPVIIYSEVEDQIGSEGVLRRTPGQGGFKGDKKFRDLKNHKIYAMLKQEDFIGIKKLKETTPVGGYVTLEVEMPNALKDVIVNTEKDGEKIYIKDPTNEENILVDRPQFLTLFGKWNADQGFAKVAKVNKDSIFKEEQEVIINGNYGYQMQYANDIDFKNFKVYFIVQESTIQGIVDGEK